MFEAGCQELLLESEISSGEFYDLYVRNVNLTAKTYLSIQATLAPPTTGKMFKGLLICYAVVLSTFFSVSISGYWAFGNLASGNIFLNFAPSGEPALIPNWLIILANILILTQLFAVSLVSSSTSPLLLELA